MYQASGRWYSLCDLFNISMVYFALLAARHKHGLIVLYSCGPSMTSITSFRRHRNTSESKRNA